MKWSGKKIMENVKVAQRKSKKKYNCPTCSRVSIKRLSSGVWACLKCKTKFASGAYEFIK